MSTRIDFNAWPLAARMEHADRCTRQLARQGVGSDKHGFLQQLDLVARERDLKAAEGAAATVLRAQLADGRGRAVAIAVQVAAEVAQQMTAQHFPGTTPEPIPCP